MYTPCMRINADFSKPALVVPREDAWVRSPESGVERLMLDRIGDEVARATSIVRYASGSSFAEHSHAKGEEFLVLDGVFSDERGDYPAGTYVRNPPGSSHAPFSRHGCRILVKLRQFDARDLQPLVIDSSDRSLWKSAVRSQARLPLHEFGTERVAMHSIAAGKSFSLGAEGGAELLLVRGALVYDGRLLGDECWIRLPPGMTAELKADSASTVWLKTGHLPAGSEDPVLHREDDL